jgi:hypothetical protein
MTPQMRKLQNELAKIHEKIYNYQLKCKHKNVVIKECGDTGNWCSSDDRYWTEYKCSDCLKFWTVDHKQP